MCKNMCKKTYHRKIEIISESYFAIGTCNRYIKIDQNYLRFYYWK